jgi:hypothetical protein
MPDSDVVLVFGALFGVCLPLADIGKATDLLRPTLASGLRTCLAREGVDLISNVLPFGRLWYAGPEAVANAIGYANFFSRSHDAVIRVYDEAGNVIQDARARGRVERAVTHFCVPQLY